MMMYGGRWHHRSNKLPLTATSEIQRGRRTANVRSKSFEPNESHTRQKGREGGRSMMGSHARLPFDPVWLFPATYAAHLVEEYFVSGGFPVWAERALGIQLSNREFIAWNTFAFGLICLGALLVSRYPRLRLIEIGIAIAVLGNAVAHIIGSLATGTYSPGLVTSVFVWIPLGWLRLQTVSQASSRRARLAGLWMGLLVTITILAVLGLRAVGPDRRPSDRTSDVHE
jgi:hypothetical protein